MKHISPYDQLIGLLQTQQQKHVLAETLEPLGKQSREDFCLACVAYIRFGVRRPFANNVMHVLFTSYCDLLDR